MRAPSCTNASDSIYCNRGTKGKWSSPHDDAMRSLRRMCKPMPKGYYQTLQWFTERDASRHN